MPNASWVSGSFHYSDDDRPLQGMIRFTPAQLWVYEHGTHWACLAPEVELDADGRFGAWLTVTEPWWGYLMETPAGNFQFPVPAGQVTYTLPDLLHEHRPGPRS